MIDDEDEDEEILKKKTSLKSVLKNLLLILLIIVGALFIYLASGTDQITNWFIGFSFICLGSTIIQIKKRPSEPTMQTLSILKCTACGITKVRNYQYGDYVFREIETCNDCNESMLIEQIYSVKLKKPTVVKKEEETKTKK